MTQGPEGYAPPTDADIRQLVARLTAQRNRHNQEGAQAKEDGRRYGHTIALERLTYEQCLELQRDCSADVTIRVMFGPDVDATKAWWTCTQPPNTVPGAPGMELPSKHYLQQWAEGLAEGITEVRGKVSEIGEMRF